MGEFSEDKRQGWGIYILTKSGDKFKGQFDKDLMHGRGIYKFTISSAGH